MTLDSLILEFNQLRDSIAEAARMDDGDLLRSLDSEIQKLFNEILSHKPSSSEQRVKYCKFLLENLVPVESRQGASQQICKKILEIVSQA